MSTIDDISGLKVKRVFWPDDEFLKVETCYKNVIYTNVLNLFTY